MIIRIRCDVPLTENLGAYETSLNKFEKCLIKSSFSTMLQTAFPHSHWSDVMAEVLAEKSWTILDVEFIRTSRSHCCIGKLYILTKNGFDMEMEFYPCRRYRDILLKYRRSYQFCRRQIHKLTYTPWVMSLPCRCAVPKLNELIVNNGIDLIL